MPKKQLLVIKKLAHLNRNTKTKVAISSTFAAVEAAVAASTGNIPGAVSKLAIGAYQAHSMLSNYKNVNYSDSCIISRGRVSYV